jgi:long-chain acyl-CoA synthetase
LDAVLASESPVDRLPWTAADPDEIVSISYTSGSTGTPKGVCHTHASWLAGARFTCDYPGVTPADTMIIPLPLYHGLAFRQILGYALAGVSLLIATDIYQALKFLRERRGTALLLVPAACNLVMHHFASVLREADAFLRYVEIGAAPLEPERLRQLGKLLPTTPVHLPYGLTEARVAFLKPGQGGRLNRISAIAPGLELKVIDGDGQPVGPGQTGEILLRGRGLMKGYWGWSEEQCARLRDQGFRTNDLACINSDGEPELLGRADDVLKIGGRKVIPQEVEAVLNRHPAVAESAVVGLPDPRGVFERELRAYVVLMDKDRKISEAELQVYCRGCLEPYKVPVRFSFRRSLPKSAVGKLLRQALESEAAPQGV